MRFNKELQGGKSLNAISYDSRLPYSTVHRYFRGNAKAIKLETLVRLLEDGLGLDLSQLAFLDVFETDLD